MSTCEKELRIDRDCRVRLRNGDTLSVKYSERLQWVSYGDDEMTWSLDGRYYAEQESEFDIVAILPSAPDVIDGPQPVAPSPVPGCYSEGETKVRHEGCCTIVETKLIPPVIDGPGEYVWDNNGVELVVKVEPFISFDDPRLRWAVVENTERTRVCLARFRDDGSSVSKTVRLLRKHVPTPEPAVESPSLLEPLSEALFWCDCGDRINGKVSPIKAHVLRSPKGAWIAEFEDFHGIFSVTDEGSVEGLATRYQLLRRVQPTSVRPYETDEDKGRMFGKTVRRKSSGREWKITTIDAGHVRVETDESGMWACWETLSTDYEYLDGTPCGVVTTDPWDTDAPKGG